MAKSQPGNKAAAGHKKMSKKFCEELEKLNGQRTKSWTPNRSCLFMYTEKQISEALKTFERVCSIIAVIRQPGYRVSITYNAV